MRVRVRVFMVFRVRVRFRVRVFRVRVRVYRRPQGQQAHQDSSDWPCVTAAITSLYYSAGVSVRCRVSVSVRVRVRVRNTIAMTHI